VYATIEYTLQLGFFLCRCTSHSYSKTCRGRPFLCEIGDVQCIPRIRIEFTPPHASWTVHRLQFPLRPAYATTFSGCQSLTLDKTVLDLRCDVFVHGQLYTALSHIRARGDSRILFSDDKNDYDYNTSNVVYKELLLESEQQIMY
jgi:hypothetical protein